MEKHLRVNGKTSTCEWKNIISNCDKRSQKFKGKQGDIDGRILIKERKGRHVYIIHYHPKEENQTRKKKKKQKHS